jgi:16S rRNA (guanine527-N7)-methyltransferase
VNGSALRRGLDALGIRRTGAAELLERFLAELDRWNARFGFVKATADELVAKHVLDSISGAATIGALCAEGRGIADPSGGVEPPGAAASRGAGRGSARPRSGVLDVGSGAGFPGIPLAIALPEVRFTLLERAQKKCAFLENCRALLGLENVTVRNVDLAAATGTFDVVTFRAVAPLDRFLADLARSKVTWRSIAAYKGRRDRIEEELAALGPASLGADIVRLQVPFVDEERHLVVLRPHRRGGSGSAGPALNLDNGTGGD